MNKYTHTEGPWRASESRSMSDRNPNDPNDMHWPVYWPDSGCCAHVARKEDATLIAQAPALLSALQELLAANAGIGNERASSVAWDAALKRLDKAEDAAREAVRLATQA